MLQDRALPLPALRPSANYFRRLKKIHLPGLMLLGAILFHCPGTAQAAGPHIGIVMSRPDATQTTINAFSSEEKHLLATLKQGKLRFTTLYPDEAAGFKGELLIIPISESTGPDILNVLNLDALKNKHFLVVSFLHALDTRYQTFLKQAGFDVQGLQTASQFLPLRITGASVESQTELMPGSAIIDVKTAQQPLAYWGDTLSAAAYTPNALLINWNWNAPFPALDWVTLLRNWARQDHSFTIPLPSAGAFKHSAQQKPSQDAASKQAAIISQAPVSTGSQILTTAPQANNSVPPPPKTVADMINSVIPPGAKPVQIAPGNSIPSPSETPDTAPPSISTQAPPPAANPQAVTLPTVARPNVGKGTKPVPLTPAQRAFIRQLGPLMPEQADVPAGGRILIAPPQAPASNSNNNVAVDPQLSEFENGFKTEETATGLAPAGTSEYYNDRKRELSDLAAVVDQVAVLHPDKAALVKAVKDQSQVVQSKFENAWFSQNYPLALAAFMKSCLILENFVLGAVPPSNVETRAIWMDRGSILQAGNADNLRKAINHLASLGFNVIYFESINAGYPLYPSKIVSQSPQFQNWDPLAVAVDEAHKDGIELHAWVWAFAVGNTRLNKIIGQPWNYPGPILSQPDMAGEMLLGRNGEHLPYGQTEYWLSPASYKARSFLINLYSELVQNYAVDGIQFDYIRYPFQKPTYPAGYESFSTNRFNAETGLDIINQPKEFTFRVWDAWKAFQVTSFVREATLSLRKIRPGLKLSAAVFPLPRHSRMAMIHQDWETWVKNGWLDTLSPMSYSRSARSLQYLVSYIHDSGDDRALVYPGLSLLKQTPIELLDTLQISQNTGVMGTTLFSAGHLDAEKQLLLQSGPFQPVKTLVPHHDPLAASREVIAETKTLVNGILSLNWVPVSRPNILAVNDSLNALDKSLGNYKKTSLDTEQVALTQQAQDMSKAMLTQVDTWQKASSDPVTQYQSDKVYQLAQKLARLVDYLAQLPLRTQDASNADNTPTITP